MVLEKKGSFMARKETIKKDFLIDTAFLLAKQEGFENVTARKLAAKAGCSTQPIFRLYENMDELCGQLYEKAVDFYSFFFEKCPVSTNEPFIDLGMAYIKFAMEEKELFKILFLSEKKPYSRPLYDILNGKNNNVTREFAKARENGIKDIESLFSQIWIFIHGIACMTITGDYDLNDEQTLEMLIDIYNRIKIKS